MNVIPGTRFFKNFHPTYNQPTKPKALHQWIFASTKVSLFRTDDRLEYVLEDNDGKKIQGPIPTPPDLPIEQCISFLTSCEPIFIEGSVCFKLPFHRWEINEHDVYLVENNGAILWILVDPKEIRTQGPVLITKEEKIELQQTIQKLKISQPVIVKDKVGFFDVCHTWFWENHKIALLRKESNLDPLIWQVLDQFSNKITYLHFEQANYYYCAMKSIKLNENGTKCDVTPLIMSTSIAERIKGLTCNLVDYIKDCKIQKLVKGDTEETRANPVLIYITAISFCSAYDKCVGVNHEEWGVTLINTGNTNTRDPKAWYGHAAIMIEGVKNGAYYSCFIDLIAKNNGTIRLIEGRDVKYSAKTKTCKIERSKAEGMIEKIKEEIALQEKGKQVSFFHMAGAESLFSTFRLDKTELVSFNTINTFESYEDMIKNILDCEPDTFDHHIWDMDNARNFWIQKLSRMNQVKCQNQELLREFKDELYQDAEDDFVLIRNKNEAELCIQNILNLEPQQPVTPKDLKPYRCVTLTDKEGNIWLESNNPRERNWEKMAHANRLAMEKEDGSWVEVVQPHNCITWASSKLRSLGIIIKHDAFNVLLARPSEVINEKGICSVIDLTADYNIEGLPCPPHIRKYAFAQYLPYMENFLFAVKNSDIIPQKPRFTLETLEVIGEYSLAWMASLHDTPGITLEICKYFNTIKLEACMSLPTQKIIESAYKLACSKGCLKEADILLDYFDLYIGKRKLGGGLIAIDSLLSNVTDEDLTIDFLCKITKINKVNLYHSNFYKDEEFRNGIYSDLSEKGFRKLKDYLESCYEYFKERESGTCTIS